MLAIERRRAILDQLNRDGRVVVSELAQALAVTEETIRRDLNQMERGGLLARAHGGALPRATEPEELPYGVRNVTNIAGKRVIGALAAGLVPDGASIMLDSSSTAYEALRALQGHRALTIVTNSVRLLADPEMTAHKVISVGGELRRRTMTFVGPVACQAAARFNGDVALVSCKALSLAAGLMDANLADAAVKRAFIERAARVILLADASKFDRTALVTITDLRPIHTIVTDQRPSDDWRARLESEGIALVHG
jgi:DeoR/GlpR family transcriptional regulator of sugar metabolism